MRFYGWPIQSHCKLRRTVSRRRCCGSGWTTGRSRWVPSFQRRSGRVYRCIGTTRSTKWSIAGTYLPAECADPQDLRAELRDGAAESDCRQGDADLRLSQTQAAAGKVLYEVGENRPRTSRAASLRQGCGGEDV